MTLILLILVACLPPPPASSDAIRAPRPARDLNPDPDIVEIELVAVVGEITVQGVSSEIWGYRDAGSDQPLSMPGPLIEVAAGTRMIVHFTNQLPESSTLHFHGMRKPNEMDGIKAVQPLVFPGETFTYDFVVRDPGLFWYHPHVRTNEQVSRGLYGPVRVRGDGGVGETADRVLVLDDVQLEDGAIDHAVVEADLRVGRMGNTVLLNGDVTPRTALVLGRERWRILNAANSRTFELSLDGHDLQVTGLDSGPAPTWTTNVLRIAPGERYEVVVELEPGEHTTLRTLAVDRGFGLPLTQEWPLLEVRAAETLIAPEPMPERASVSQPPLPVNPEVLVLELGEGTAYNGAPIFSINGESWPFADAIPRSFDAVESWTVVNQTSGNHPFHLHGLYFTVRDIDGVPPPWTGLKDTVDIAPGATANLTVHYHTPGIWLFHSHLLDHASMGMMGQISVQ